MWRRRRGETCSVDDNNRRAGRFNVINGRVGRVDDVNRRGNRRAHEHSRGRFDGDDCAGGFTNSK